jgi:hypothetical protein
MFVIGFVIGLVSFPWFNSVVMGHEIILTPDIETMGATSVGVAEHSSDFEFSGGAPLWFSRVRVF